MDVLRALKTALHPMSYPQTAFGLNDMQFFLALLRACPTGSRLSFDRSEPESFVHALRPWSFRDDPRNFEADSYTIDDGFIAAVEREVAVGTLQLDHHFGIVAPDGRLLCSSLDEFTVVTLAEDITRRISESVATRIAVNGKVP